MLIGNLKIDDPVLLAPMAGYTDMPFRLICRERGAGAVYTEFVSSEGLVRGSEKTNDYLVFDERERPIGMQIFGHDPDAMAESARLIEAQFHPDIIDLNFGCSVKKVVKRSAGSALLKDLPLMQKIASVVVRAVRTPVTAKIRAGWSRQSIIAVAAAKMLESEGICALTVHPRTAVEGFKFPADWKIITEVKSQLSIPVIGNGDVNSENDAVRMFRETGCDGVMIGRGALADPWIFQKTNELLHTGQCSAQGSILERIELCQHHLSLEVTFRGETDATTMMKKRYRWYFRGIRNASSYRERLVRSHSLSETQEIIRELKASVCADPVLSQ
ncbi:MAG: tRNA dihydrouridine synthase DusB [archaeon]